MTNSVIKYFENDIYFIDDSKFGESTLKKCREIHRNYQSDGIIKNSFDDNTWICYNGKNKTGINFSLNRELYSSHIGKELGISLPTMTIMLKCFAINLFGSYVQQSIASRKINAIIQFLEYYKEPQVRFDEYSVFAVEQFLAFINTPDTQISLICALLPRKKTKPHTQRKLASIINYLVVDEELSRLFDYEETRLGNDEFIKLFPIYFWAKITFIIPLRPTEMMLTPFNCITRDAGKTYITLRRTQLKKKKKTVHYSVPKDYKEFKYEIPNGRTVSNIEKYISLTKSHHREYLFDYDEKTVINGMMSVSSFERNLDFFIDNYINGNANYNFAKHASGLVSFEHINIGDSRHLALINLRSSDVLPHICQQLADHESIETTAGYYSNISEVIQASSFMTMQKRINSRKQDLLKTYRESLTRSNDGTNSICTSEKRAINNKDISDCIEQKHIQECFGCKFYSPSKTELGLFYAIVFCCS